MTLSWFSIFRLGLVQMCLGAVVVLMTSTLNRLMVVELSMAATIPGFLVTSSNFLDPSGAWHRMLITTEQNGLSWEC
jgi:hypothetical protein